MSKNLSERIVVLETNSSYMTKEINHIKNTVNSIEQKMDNFTEKLDKKYAKKTSVDKIRRIIWGIIAFFFVGVWGVLLKMLLKQ